MFNLHAAGIHFYTFSQVLQKSPQWFWFCRKRYVSKTREVYQSAWPANPINLFAQGCFYMHIQSICLPKGVSTSEKIGMLWAMPPVWSLFMKNASNLKLPLNCQKIEFVSQIILNLLNHRIHKKNKDDITKMTSLMMIEPGNSPCKRMC